ncbi:cop9 signalosome complex subunit 12 [Pyrenophora seminiperda CCB06]|uniref:Protein CSN12 homolog n=1 Tax=Pyrenophora seminiperda CCB06 TaxID=1302712 RepID=A0A3M7LZ65_9PLEO|nr:cop9 signalosome complex subunit 12 [Pyrenophora seminiperda CCB06]
MQAALEPFHQAYASGQAEPVAHFFSPVAPSHDPGRLYEFYRASSEDRLEGDVKNALRNNKNARITNKESTAWIDIISCYWRAIREIIQTDEAANQGRLGERQYVAVYDAWKDLTSSFIKHISAGLLPGWAIFTLSSTANHLRKIASRADEHLAKSKSATLNNTFSDDVVSTAPQNQKLEEVARVLNRIFALCLGDRNQDLKVSRKWGVYCIANLQFKTYFKLKAISLSKNVVRSIEAQSDLFDFESYPAAHRCTYKYYLGVLSFLQEDYIKAERSLQEAWQTCLASSQHNKSLILTYLIPCRLITRHKLPTANLLAEAPRLARIFGPLVSCIKRGDLTGFDKALAEGEPELVKRRIFLTMERSRDITLRNLLRKVYLAGGYDELKEGQTEADRIRKSRVPLANFAAALRMGTAGEGSGQVVEDEEVECLLANQIYKGLMKGYISREHRLVVMNKKGSAFPGTGV